MEHAMQTMMRTTLLVLALVPWGTESVLAQAYPPPGSGPPPASSPPLASNPPSQRVFWQGPSLGFDFGGDGARTMMLVYDLPATDAIYQRFVGIEGSAYFVGGLGMTALSFNNIVVVPVRSGVGLRLGANVGYLKFTPTSTWNPF